MKKLIVLLMVLAGAVQAENVIWETFYSDGSKLMWPDTVTARLFLNGTQIDTDELDSASNFRESDSMIICTLTATGIGKHKIYFRYIETTDANMDIYTYDNSIDANIIAISNDTTASDNFETMLDGTGGKALSANINGYVKVNTGYNNIILNGSFEEDSAQCPKRWTQLAGGYFSDSKCLTASTFGMGRYSYSMSTPSGEDTMVIYQNIGMLQSGYYGLSASMMVVVTGGSPGAAAIVYIDQGLTGSESGWNDSLIINAEKTGTLQSTKILTLLAADTFSVGVVLYAGGPADTAIFDEIKLSYLGPLTIANVTNIGGLGHQAYADTIANRVLEDSSAYQGAASGLTAAEIIDSILGIAVADTVTGRIIAQLISQLDSVQTAMADDHVAKQKDSALFTADSVLYVATVDTVLKSISSTVDLAGEGAYAVTIRAVDSSGTDAAISGVPIGITDLAGTLQGYLTTNTSGYVTFNQDSGSWIISAATRNGYRWIQDTVLVPAAAKTDTLWGYNIPVGSPGSANLCRLYGYMYGIDGQPVNGGVITASLPGRNMIDSCVGGALDGYEKSATTDSVGYWYLDLVRTLCVQSTIGSTAVNKYKVVGRFPSGSTAFEKTYEVPDSTSHKMTW